VAVEKARNLAAGRGVAVNFEIGNIMAPDWPPRHQQNAFDWVDVVGHLLVVDCRLTSRA
jgi:hypothetical protein